MRTIFTSFILAGTIVCIGGCRTDSGSRVSSDLNERSSNIAPKTLDRASPSPQRDNAAHDTRPLIVCFGDSLTAGLGADEGKSYPDFLQRDLDKEGFRYRVVNDGVSGDTTKDGVDRVDAVVDMKPAVVVLEFGGNDGLRGLPVEMTRANLSNMIVKLKGSGAKVVLAGITLPPDYGHDYITNFTATYPTLQKKYQLPLLPFILKNAYGVDGMIQKDGIHATNKGNEVVAKNVLPLVEPLLKK